MFIVFVHMYYVQTYIHYFRNDAVYVNKYRHNKQHYRYTVYWGFELTGPRAFCALPQ